jgi:hypothetical protein
MSRFTLADYGTLIEIIDRLDDAQALEALAQYAHFTALHKKTYAGTSPHQRLAQQIDTLKQSLRECVDCTSTPLTTPKPATPPPPPPPDPQTDLERITLALRTIAPYSDAMADLLDILATAIASLDATIDGPAMAIAAKCTATALAYRDRWQRISAGMERGA